MYRTRTKNGRSGLLSTLLRNHAKRNSFWMPFSCENLSQIKKIEQDACPLLVRVH